MENYKYCPYTGKTCDATCGKYHEKLKKCADLALVDAVLAFMDDQSDGQFGSPSEDLYKLGV